MTIIESKALLRTEYSGYRIQATCDRSRGDSDLGITSTCNNLVLAEAYCVQSSNSTTTGPPSNVASGTITLPVGAHNITPSSRRLLLGHRHQIQPDNIPVHRNEPRDSSTCNNLALGEAYGVQSNNSTTTPPLLPPSNVAPGPIISGSTEYYTVVSEDSCSAVDIEFSTTLSQFFAMNPEISSTCNILALGAAYCVKFSNSTTTPTAPSNLATGSLTNCTTYRTVLSGDNCANMKTTFKTAAADFFR